MIEFEVRHTAEGLTRTYKEWWSQRFGRAYSVAFGLAVVAFTAMLTMKRATWWLVAITTSLVMYAAYLTVVRDNAIKLALKGLELLGDGPLSYRLDDTAIREESVQGSFTIRWRAFGSMTRQNSALLIFRKPADAQSFFVLPLDQIPPDAEAFIRARLQP